MELNVNDITEVLDLLDMLYQHSAGFSEDTGEWVLNMGLADSYKETYTYISKVDEAMDRLRDFANSYGEYDSFTVVKK